MWLLQLWLTRRCARFVPPCSFVICNFPPDSSPPELGDAVLNAQQLDSETVMATWGGFRDEESEVKGY